MPELRTITELREKATVLIAENYSLELWPDGTWFIETPQGEGTGVPEEAVAGALALLFKIFF